ncbi:MAG: 5-formyltetrahydrofolate cyclo-ligase [Candidatus Omnitrophica bacterium]|nr:5-formyltetrahydrofolate cyclo-ligase [Candidatus Omnitrophota bacterium]
MKEKDKIRKEILAKLRSLDEKERSISCIEIKGRLFVDNDFKKAESIMFYISKDYEVDTWSMIEDALKLGKRIIVPVTDVAKKSLILSEITGLKGQLQKGPYGIYEPKKESMKAVKIEDIDMVVVPGIAFDKKGNRIGHGGGYFDRFLKNLPKKIPTIGLAFSCQIVDRIKTLSWDIPVTKVITA